MSVGAGKLATEAGITYRQLDHWTRNGFITAEQYDTGSGYHRSYSETERRVTRIMGPLVADGLHPKTASRVAREIVTGGTARLGGFTVMGAV